MNGKIWKTSVLDEYELDPLDENTITFLENYFKVELPTSYLTILKQQNGGYLYVNKFPHLYEGEHLNVDYLHGMSKTRTEGILQSTYLIKEWDLPKDSIVISGAGPQWICLDYRNIRINPKIVLIDAELEIENKLADSFDEFLNKLYRGHESSYIEDITFEGEKTEFTYEEGEKVFSGKSVGEISLAILHFTNTDSDTNWFLRQLLKLTKKENEFIVQDVAEALYRIVDQRYDNEENIDKNLIKEVLEQLKGHFDTAVRNYAKKIQRLFDNKNL